MAKKVNQHYAPFKTTTPKVEFYYNNLSEPDQFSEKYDIGVYADSEDMQPVINRLVEWQNECLEKEGLKPEDTLLCLKDEKSKDEATGKYTNPTGRTLIFFKSADQSKFSVVGPNKKPIDPSTVGKGDLGRVNGQAAFGMMKGDPYVTLYLNAVQLIESGGANGVDAFDDETGGEDNAPFNDETNHDDVTLE
jgi:hypothetical protein